MINDFFGSLINNLNIFDAVVVTNLNIFNDSMFLERILFKFNFIR